MSLARPDHLSTDVLIIGGGAAALRAAMSARERCDDVTIVSKGRIAHSGSTVISGASFAAEVDGDVDDREVHLQDTLRAGHYLNDEALVRLLVDEAGTRIRELQNWGVPFYSTENDLLRRHSPGHSKPRNVRVQTSEYRPPLQALAITMPLLQRLRTLGVRRIERASVVEILLNDGQAVGAMAVTHNSGEPLFVHAGATVLAAGGGSALFSRTTNTSDVVGESYALALRAGATLQDMEFVQYHPLGVVHPFKLTLLDSVFGDGAVLRNALGWRFMRHYAPETLEMSTRDIISRAIFSEVKAGRGDADGVYLDCSQMDSGVLAARYDDLLEAFSAQQINLERDYVIVSPLAHFFNGGVVIDRLGRTGVPRLFAAGEAAGGVHGANRLPGNALPEALVFGARVGRAAAEDALTGSVPLLALPSYTPMEVGMPRRGDTTLLELRESLRQVMWSEASIVRSESSLRRARHLVGEARNAASHAAIPRPRAVTRYFELKNMCLAAEAIIESALLRTESRASHYREDYPHQDDAHWQGNTTLRLAGDSVSCRFEPRTIS